MDAPAPSPPPASEGPRTCLNCHAILVGRFCSDCGQKDVDPDKGLFEVVFDLVSEAFEADGRLHRTILPFFFRPGRLTADWLAGRRARYTSPARIFVFALFVGFVGLSLAAQREVATVPDDPVEHEGDRFLISPDGGGSVEMSFDLGDDSFDGTQREVAEKVIGEIVEQGPKLVFALVPILALLLKVVLWRTNALTHVVFSLLLHSRMLVLGGVAVALPWQWPRGLVFLALQVYLVVGMRHAYSLSWRQTAWRVGLVAPAYFGAWVAGLVLLALWATYVHLL